jgi:hypothetical protein
MQGARQGHSIKPGGDRAVIPDFGCNPVKVYGNGSVRLQAEFIIY